MKVLISIIFLFISYFHLASQTFKIEAKINNCNSQRAYLLSFHYSKTVLLDSASVLDGDFSFIMKNNYQPGLYRIILSDYYYSGFNIVEPVFFDVIYNNENIELGTVYTAPEDSMKILRSDENKIYYEFQAVSRSYKKKFFHIKSLLDEYSPGDPFYGILSEEFIDIQQDNSQALIELIEKLPGSVASSIIRMHLLPIIHPSISGPELTAFYKEHFFDLVSFTDRRLLNSPIYDRKILEYLSFFKNASFTSREQDQSYFSGVDRIMDKVSVDPEIYDYVLNFLVDVFDKLKIESVLVHLAENYVEGGCETNSKKLMEKRLEGYKKMAIGNKVPDIIMLNENGKQFRLYDLRNNYILVLFWASWCPHCTNLMPQMKKWYETKSINLQIYAVSIDSSRFAWEENLMMNNYPWINTCTFAGWNDKAAKEYNIYATPTMFLINRERKIIAKPLTFREFRREVDKLK